MAKRDATSMKVDKEFEKLLAEIKLKRIMLGKKRLSNKILTREIIKGDRRDSLRDRLVRL